ncbi:hypothetical protein V5F59_08585 [Xanthobacter autotrophicus DSM 431]|uniref:hypothetical protein n=1 Tax=Xanthobacter nonsaccharivorans TaxID=3119912 RepID=UPI00372C9324
MSISANVTRIKGTQMTETERHTNENKSDIPIPNVVINFLKINIIIGLLLFVYFEFIASPDKIANGGGKFGPIAMIAFISFMIGRLIFSWEKFVLRQRIQTKNYKLTTKIGIVTLARYISVMSSIMCAAIAIITVTNTL